MKFLAVLLFFGVAFAQKEIAYDNCGGDGKIHSVKVTPCVSEPCVFKRGSTAVMDVSLHLSRAAQKIEIKPTVNISNIAVGIPGVNRDGCTYVKCPTEAGKDYQVKINIPIAKSTPAVTSLVKFQVFADKKLAICGSTTIKFE